MKGDGFEFPFRFISQWYDYQQDFINSINPSEYTEEAMFVDFASYFEVIVQKKKILLRKNAKIELYGNRMVIDGGAENEIVYSFDKLTAVSVLGRNKLNIYLGGTVYQFKGSKRFNALKYVNIYYRYKNITKGEGDGKFLGL